MAENLDLETRICLVWRTKKSWMNKPRRSSVFTLLDSKWYLKMSSELIDNEYYYTISLHEVLPKTLKACFKVTTFIETDKLDNVLPFRVTQTINRTSGQDIWKFKAEIINKAVQGCSHFPSTECYGEWKVICLFRCFVPSYMLQTTNETIYLSTEAGRDPLMTSARVLFEPSEGKLSSEKSVQASVDIQPDLERLSHDFSKLLEDEKIPPDVQLRCGEQTLFAHRTVLAARSSVFAAMFRNKMLESETGFMYVEDVEASTLKLLLRYSYSGKIRGLSKEAARKLYEAADKYNMDTLRLACAKLMVGSLTEANCLDFLLLSDARNDKDLMNAVVNFIVEHTQVFNSQAWLEFNEEHPKLSIRVYRMCFPATLSDK